MLDRPPVVPPPQDTLLRECFERARVHPFYRGFYRGSDDHAVAPAVDKHTLLPALQEFSPRDELRGVYLVRSGGSSHAPLIFPVDIRENHAQRAALAGRLLDAGVFDARTVALNLFSYSDLYRTAAILDDLLERCDATTLPMSAHARHADVHAAALRFRPTHVLGTPSLLALFARFLAAGGARLDVPHLLYAGELLRGSQLDLLRATLGTRQVWSLYGGAETGIWAWSDASRRPGLFEVLPQVVVEVLSPDGDGYGPLAVTNAYRRRFPVFRYRLGDVGRLVERDGTRYLELRGRDARSFQFNELTYDLESFAPLVGRADAFQIQLRFDAAGRDRLLLLLVGEEGALPAALGARLAALLERPADSGACEVQLVGAERLHVDPVTTKTPAIVDFRR